MTLSPDSSHVHEAIPPFIWRLAYVTGITCSTVFIDPSLDTCVGFHSLFIVKTRQLTQGRRNFSVVWMSLSLIIHAAGGWLSYSGSTFHGLQNLHSLFFSTREQVYINKNVNQKRKMQNDTKIVNLEYMQLYCFSTNNRQYRIDNCMRGKKNKH